MSLYNTDDPVQALFPDISGLELVIFPKCDQLHAASYSSNPLSKPAGNKGRIGVDLAQRKDTHQGISLPSE